MSVNNTPVETSTINVTLSLEWLQEYQGYVDVIDMADAYLAIENNKLVLTDGSVRVPLEGYETCSIQVIKADETEETFA